MSFIDTSVLTNTTNNLIGSASASAIAKTQSAITRSITPLTNLASKSIVSALGINNSVVANVASSVLTNGLTSAVGSLTKSFSVDPTSLAKGLDSTLSGVFKDTNIKTASTIATAISDPVAGLASKLPNSSGFKLTSSEAGSQIISSAGSSSEFGSKASSLIGTNLSTVMNRFNLDSVNNLAGSITNNNLTTGLKGLFSNISSVTKQVGSVARAAISISNTINRATGNSLYGNDTQIFLNKVGNLSAAVGGSDLSKYVVSSPTTSILDSNGSTVDTHSTGIDATTTNLIASVASLAGCNVPGGYQSYSAIGSYFNTSLNLAIQGGLGSIVNSLINCAFGTTSLGQQSLTTGFNTSIGSVVSLAASILSKINNPSALNTISNRQTLLTNQSLSASDATLVESIFNGMGTTTIKAMSVDSASSTDCPVIDYTTATNTNKSFLTAATGSSTISDFLNATPMDLNKLGVYSVMT